jgi:hypothetical protein
MSEAEVISFPATGKAVPANFIALSLLLYKQNRLYLSTGVHHAIMHHRVPQHLIYAVLKSH